MDLLRHCCFPKEREYLLELATWSQKMGFACLAIIERPIERRRLTDQIGSLMVPDMCVSYPIDCYVNSFFLEDNSETFKWLLNGKTAETPRADDDQPRASPARHPLTVDTEPITNRPANEAVQPHNQHPEGNPPAESRTDENILDVESEANDPTDTHSDGGDDAQTIEDGNVTGTVTPLSLCTLLNNQKRVVKALRRHRSSLCRRAIGIDSLQSTLPSPFVPLYNKAEAEMKDLQRKLRRMVRRLGHRLIRYIRLLEKENKLRQQIYQNLLHVTPLQVLLLGHLPRDQQMALLDVIAAARKFSVPLLLSRLGEMRRAQFIEMENLQGKVKIEI